jgi:hypothetical protein
MGVEFDAELKRLEGKILWTVFYAPAEAAGSEKGRVNVRGTVDGHEFSGVLLASRNGPYVVYNQELKDLCGKQLGDSVHVFLEADDAPRVLVVPDDIKQALAAQPGAADKFESLAYYLRRGEINKITSAKTEPTRARRIQELLRKLE